MALLTIDESELRKRITEHLAARPGLTDVMVFWDGYVLALNEIGMIDSKALDRLMALLPPHDGMASVEAMCGEEYFEEHPTRNAAKEATQNIAA